MTHSRPARTLFEWCSQSVNVLWGANCFNTTTFLLNSWAGLFKLVYPRLYAISWRHITVSMNPEFLVKFKLGGNVAIVVLIKWFYGERTPCTSPRLYFKLNAIHGHVTWQHHSPSTLKLKIKKSLSNRPIRWRTLYYKYTQNCAAITDSALAHISSRPVFSKSQVLIQFSLSEICGRKTGTK